MKPLKTSGKLVLCTQFWAGDREAAMRNARRIADNEPKFRDDAEFLFVARFDSTHDRATVEHVSKKFKVSTWTATRHGTGWPAGCNDTWCDTACNYFLRQLYDGKWDNVKAILTFEGDCIPVMRDWISQLSAEWDRAAAKGKFVVGAFMPPPVNGPYGHINGNSMYPPDLFERVPAVLGCDPTQGWDYALAPQFRNHWYPTPLITNYYKAKNVAVKDIRRRAPDGRVPVLIHGTKDSSISDFADYILYPACGPEPEIPAASAAPKSEKLIETLRTDLLPPVAAVSEGGESLF
jgi:hypothetical protein